MPVCRSNVVSANFLVRCLRQVYFKNRPSIIPASQSCRYAVPQCNFDRLKPFQRCAQRSAKSGVKYGTCIQCSHFSDTSRRKKYPRTTGSQGTNRIPGKGITWSTFIVILSRKLLNEPINCLCTSTYLSLWSIFCNINLQRKTMFTTENTKNGNTKSPFLEAHTFFDGQPISNTLRYPTSAEIRLSVPVAWGYSPKTVALQPPLSDITTANGDFHGIRRSKGRSFWELQCSIESTAHRDTFDGTAFCEDYVLSLFYDSSSCEVRFACYK